MHLIIDGYNLLHVDRLPKALNQDELRRERDRLVDQLSVYRHVRPFEITVVFDGWQGGWATETKERQKGIELIFSRLGEKADEVIKRLVKEKGQGAIVVTSDQEVARYAERLEVAVVRSDQFREKMDLSRFRTDKGNDEQDEEERGGIKRKGPSRRLSKEERRSRAALKKL